MKKPDNLEIKENEIKLEDTLVSYTIRRSIKAKNVRFSVSLHKGLEIVIPMSFPVTDVETLIQQREKWVLKNLQSVEEMRARLTSAQQDSLTKIRYLGKVYRIVVILDNSSPIRVELKENKAFLTLPDRNEKLIRQVIEAWYKWAAKSLFEERVNVWADCMQLSYRHIFIKNQKTRWGSCSKQQNLNFNLKVIMAPLDVVDYVVIHELAHLKEMNHSRSFWQLVEEFCPDYKKQLAWLKENGYELVI